MPIQLPLTAPAFVSPCPLAAGQLHIWLLDMRLFTQTHHSAALQMMDSAEHARANKFARGKEEYIASRWLLRSVLARYTRQNADTLELLRTDKGKLYLPAYDIQFSLSHSGHWAVLALGKVEMIGIDIEHIKSTRNLISIAEHYYHPDELARLQSLPSSEQQDYFYRLWTLKEAFFKALGTGISAGLEKLSFELEGDAITASIDERLDAEGTPWQFRQWALTPQDYCALAYKCEQGLDTKWFDALPLPAFP